MITFDLQSVADNPLEAARAVLPEIVSWGNGLILVPFAYMAALVAMIVSARIALRPLRADSAWWERARDAQVARVVGLLGVTMMPAFVSLLAIPMSGPLAKLPPAWLQLLVAFAAFCAAAMVATHIEGVVLRRHVTLAIWLRDGLFASLVLSPHVFFPVVGGIVVTHVLVDRTALGCGVTLAVTAFGLAGGGFLVARVVGLVRVAPERVQGIVTIAAAAAGVARPRSIYECRASAANAYALGSRGIALTSGAIELLGDEDLIAIVMHELAHLAEPRRARRGRHAFRALQSFAFISMLPLTEWFGTWTFFVAAYAAILAFRLRLRFARKAEAAADGVATHHEPHAGAYARALERLHAVNLIPAVVGTASTHPDLYDRLLAVGATPSFPRPMPPENRVAGGLFWLAMGLIVGTGILVRGVVLARSADATDEGPVITEIALSGGNAFSLARLASFRAERGDTASALVLLRAAVALAPGDPYYPARAAALLAPLGRCDEAQAYLGEAESIEQRRSSWKQPEGAVVDAQRAVAACLKQTNGEAALKP